MPTKNRTLSELLKKRRVVPRWRAPSKSVEILGKKRNWSEETQRQVGNWAKNLLSKQKNENTIGSARELSELCGMYPESITNISQNQDLSNVQHIELFDIDKIRNRFTLGSIGDEVEISDDGTLNDAKSELEISRIRKRLHLNAANPLLWSELARHYTIVGQDEKAKRAMIASLHLESPRVYRRLNLLRELANESTTYLLPGSPGPRSSFGVKY